MHAEYVPHLPAVAVDGDPFSFERGVKKMRNPALVLIPKLPRSRNARHAEHYCRQRKHPAIVVDVLISCAFGAAVRRVQIKRLSFTHAFIVHSAIAFSGQH